MVYQEAKSEISHDHDIINENEADELLKPYLLALATDIKNGKEKVIDSEEFFNELKKS